MEEEDGVGGEGWSRRMEEEDEDGVEGGATAAWRIQ